MNDRHNGLQPFMCKQIFTTESYFLRYVNVGYVLNGICMFIMQAERKEAPFELVKKVVEKERKEGNEHFNVGYRHGAISKYKRVSFNKKKANCIDSLISIFKISI